MASSQFWQERARLFQQIPGCDVLRADGTYIIGSGESWRWQLSGGATEFTRETFETMARNSAFEIAPIGTTDLLVAWLEAIRNEHINFHFYQHQPATDSKGLQYMLGNIDRVCEASATLCRRLADRALQTEFEEKHRNDSKNWSALRQRFEAFKAIKELQTGPHEPIPEALVRDAIADQFGIKPEEVTWKQIQFEVAGLLRDYPAITLIPSSRNVEAEIAPELEENPIAESPANREKEIERRQKLLADYKTATGDPPDYRIYNAKNSGIHKPQFYAWKKGTLSSRTTTARNFERFLYEKKPPIPRKPQT
jgi:hypothetical protein